jgi:hypothetical protein
MPIISVASVYQFCIVHFIKSEGLGGWLEQGCPPRKKKTAISPLNS